MEPWLVAVLIAVAVVVIVALALYWLRRRRAGTVLMVPRGDAARGEP